MCLPHYRVSLPGHLQRGLRCLEIFPTTGRKVLLRTVDSSLTGLLLEQSSSSAHTGWGNVDVGPYRSLTEVESLACVYQMTAYTGGMILETSAANTAPSCRQ